MQFNSTPGAPEDWKSHRDLVFLRDSGSPDPHACGVRGGGEGASAREAFPVSQRALPSCSYRGADSEEQRDPARECCSGSVPSLPDSSGVWMLHARGTESLCCSLLGTHGAASGPWVAPPDTGRNVRTRERGRAVPGAGSGSARRGQSTKTKLNFETKLGGHPGGRVNTWHGGMEAAGSPGAAPRYKMRHNQQSKPSDLHFNVVTC